MILSDEPARSCADDIGHRCGSGNSEQAVLERFCVEYSLALTELQPHSPVASNACGILVTIAAACAYSAMHIYARPDARVLPELVASITKCEPLRHEWKAGYNREIGTLKKKLSDYCEAIADHILKNKKEVSDSVPTVAGDRPEIESAEVLRILRRS